MTTKNQEPPVYNATPVYATVATDDMDQQLLLAGRFEVREEYRQIPEARNLTWEDDFFQDEMDSDQDANIVAVFDMDYDAMESFYTSIGWISYALTLLYPPLFAIATVVCCVPLVLRSNVQWAVRAKHVAITRDGIRFVTDRRSCGWGLSCMDVGKNSKTVPFDKITDCDIQEPAGNECICIPRVLFNVRVDTASSGQDRHELVLAGLKDPFGFKKLVWAMKRAQQQQRPGPNNNALEIMRTMPALAENNNAGGSDDIAGLLREIRDELRVNNETLKTMQNNTEQAPAPVVHSAPGGKKGTFA